MRKSNIIKRMLCVLLSACLLAGILTPLDGIFRVEAASDDMYEYKYKNEKGEDVTVWVSKTGEFKYNSFPFGYETRGGYVFAKIDPIGRGKSDDMIKIWLSQDGPCGDGTVCTSWDEYLSSGKLFKSDKVGEKGNWAYGNYEQSMFWFSEKDFKFGGTKSEVATLISEYLQAYMKKYFNFVYTENFKNDIDCEVIWGNSVQLLNHSIAYGAADDLDFNEKDKSLRRDEKGVLDKTSWTVYEDGTGLTSKKGKDALGCRVSQSYMSHCCYDTSKNEKICYSYFEMCAAQKRLAGTDGKGYTAAYPGYVASDVADQATGFASASKAEYKTERWNAAVRVHIPHEDIEIKLHLAFYDRETEKFVQVGTCNPQTLLRNGKDISVTGWSVPTNYLLVLNDPKHPAFHVGQEGSAVKFDADNYLYNRKSTIIKGELNSAGMEYHMDSLPQTSDVVIWIPVEKIKPLYVQYWDTETGKAVGWAATEVAAYTEGDVPGKIDVESILLTKKDGSSYTVDWSRGSSANGFFAVRGDDSAICASKDAALGASAEKYSNGSITVEIPAVNMNGKMYSVSYTVLWVPVVKQAQRVDIVYIDADTGKQIGSTVTDTDVSRGSTYIPSIPTGYTVSEDGTYKSKGAYLLSKKTSSISNGYSDLLNGNKTLTYSKKDYSFRIPEGDAAFVSCKLFIPLKKDGTSAKLYVHYYDADTGKRIGDTGTLVGDIATGSTVKRFCITDTLAVPDGYMYDGGTPTTAYGSVLNDTAHNFSKAKNLPLLAGSVSAEGLSLYGKTTGKVPKGTKYVCMWIPVIGNSGKAQVTVEFINADTGAVINGSKVSVPADKGSIFNTLEKAEVPDGYTIDNTRSYRAKAAYSGTVMQLDCTYAEMGNHTALSFINYVDYSVMIPGDKGSLGVKIFIPVIDTPSDVKKANIIYYDISTDETLETVKGLDVPAGANSYTPAGIKGSITKNGTVYSRVDSNTYMYYTKVKGKDISGTGYGSRSSLTQGAVTGRGSATVSVPAGASELNIYIGMSAGDYILSVFYVDADTGETVDVDLEVGHYRNQLNLYEFDRNRRIIYNGIEYSILSVAEDATCQYPSEVFYNKYYMASDSYAVKYSSCLPQPPFYETSFVRIPGQGNGGKARYNETSLIFGPWSAGYQGKVVNAYIPCRPAKRVEIHCVDKDNTGSTDFLANYDILVQPGEDVSRRLEEFVIGGITYRPMADGSDIAIAFDDAKTVISYDAAKASSYGSVTHSVKKDGDLCTAVTKEADKSGKHTVMYVLYESDSPKVTVEYVALKDGDIDKVLLTKDGGSATYGKNYSYSGVDSVTVGGTKYIVTGEDDVLAYGDYAYTTALSDTKNKKGVQVSYDGSGKWTTEKKYNSHEDGILYIPVEEDGYPVTVKYITIKASGAMDKVIASIDGGKAVVGKKYTYTGATEVTGTDGKKYTVLGEKEAFAYDSNKYKAALDDTGNTKGMKAVYSAGKWTTEKKVKKAEKGTLYIPVKTGIPVRIIYIDTETDKHVLEVPGSPAEPEKKYTTPYEPAVPADDGTTYLPDPENPPKYTFSEEPYRPGLKTPVNDPDEPSVTTPKIPSDTPSVIIYIPVKKDKPGKAPEPGKAEVDKTAAVKAKIVSDDFDVDKAIPSTEYEYAEIEADGYILKVKMHSVTGTKKYTVHASQTVYNEVTKYDADGNPDGTDVTKTSDSATSTATRTYSYWLIDEIGYYTLDSVKVENGSADDAMNYFITSKDIVFPELIYSADAAASAHITEPGLKDEYVTAPDLHYLDGVIVSGSTVGSYAASRAAGIGAIRCSNDVLTFDGVKVLDGKTADASASAPNLTPIEKKAPVLKLKTSQVQIPAERKNILYDDSKGTATYAPKVVYKGTAGQQKVTIKNINAVKVHTPVYNKTSLVEDNLQYVQSVTADKTKYHVVVGRSESYGSAGNENITSDFSIEVSLTGQHITEKGYGKRDYSKYVLGYGTTVNGTAYPRGVQVQFPFDVVADVGNDGNEDNDVVLEANKWYTIYARYYVPEWVAEGTYTGKVRVLACNAKGDYDAMQKKANLTDTNYAACDEFEIEVSGKMYGLTLTSNSSTAPDWKDVFTLNGKIKNSLTKKYADGTFSTVFSRDLRYYYTAGILNELGLSMTAKSGGKTLTRNSMYTYPLLAGSSPALKGSGMLKSGYTWNFKLETVGRKTANEASTLVVLPTFYWISKDGKTREKVDLWYSGKVDGKTYNYIKAGSALDAKNIFKDYAESDTMGIPEAETSFAAAIRKQKDAKDDSTVKNTAIYTYGGISLSRNTKTYTNDIYAKLFASRQSTFNETQLRQLKQTWYFKYSLPDVYHICAEGNDVDAYVKKNGGCTYKEDFWRKDGYLVVHFDIGAYDKDGNLVMTYTNTSQNVLDGMCDMWKTEGYQTSRTDSNGKQFTFVDGDVIIVALPGSTGKNPPSNKSEDNEVNRLN